MQKKQNLWSLTSSYAILIIPFCCVSFTLNLSVRDLSITQDWMKSSNWMLCPPLLRSKVRITTWLNWGDLLKKEKQFPSLCMLKKKKRHQLCAKIMTSGLSKHTTEPFRTFEISHFSSLLSNSIVCGWLTHLSCQQFLLISISTLTSQFTMKSRSCKIRRVTWYTWLPTKLVP